MIRQWAVVLLAATFAACSLEIAGPNRGGEGLPRGLEAAFSVEPAEVAPHAPFTVELRVTNTAAAPVEVVTAHGCLAIPHVLRDGVRVPWEGTAVGCTAAITTHRFEPGESRHLSWTLRAELYAEHPGDTGGEPAPKGTYRVRAEFDTFSEAGSAAKPSVERTLRVR